MADKKALEVLVLGYGSAEVTFIDRLIGGLAGRGVRVTLASPSKNAIRPFRSANVKWLWVPSLTGGRIGRFVSLIRLGVSRAFGHTPRWYRVLLEQAQGLSAKVAVFLRYAPFVQHRWDVIYFLWNSSAIDYIGLFDSATPVVVSCRGTQVNIRPYLSGQESFRAGLTKTFARAARVHCVSQNILEEAEKFALDLAKAVVIHPAVDPDYFVPAASRKPHAALRLVNVSSLIWSKGHEYLLMSVGFLRDMGVDAELHIIGGGYERDHILFTVRDLGLEGKVTLHGRLPTANVLEELQQADIFVFSGVREGFGNAILEAMSCGLPVVTSDDGGVSEAVSDGVEGFVVPVREPMQMAEALRVLALDPELRYRMGAAARRRVQQMFRLADQIEAFIALFESTAICEGMSRDHA